jgi:hypothetical protein
LAGKIDTLLKLSIVAAVLLASSSVGYYYLVYLPRRDARLDLERATERERADAEKRAERERALSEQRAIERRQSAEKAAAQIRYDTCLTRAYDMYDASWTAACKRLGEKRLKDHHDCMRNELGRTFCDSTYDIREVSPNCALPRVIATELKADLEKGRDRCLQENKSGLQ